MDNRLIVSYGRLSQEDFVKESEYSSSIYNQLGFIKSYARSMNLVVDREYIDDGYSGITFDRPGFKRLKEDIENGLIGTVITKDMSRLGRNFLETAYYISEYFPKNNVRYIAINDCFDSNNPEDNEQEVMLGIRSLINDRYVKEASVKRKQVAMAKTEEGQFIGFIAPYGYKIRKIEDKRFLEVDENAANVVKRIFTEVASGKTRQEVADGLNRDKVIPPFIHMKMTPSKKKKYYYDWSSNVVYRILKNKTYTGRIVKRKSSKQDYRQKQRQLIPIRDRETIENCHPIIISDELFEVANSRLRQMKRRKKNDYCGLFSGLVICGTCGRTMTACRVQKKGKKVQYYFGCTKVVNRKQCKNRKIADSRLRTIVKENLKDIIDNYVDDNKIVSKATKDILKNERLDLKLSNLKEDIEFHNANIKNLYLKKTIGKMTLNEFIEQKEEEVKQKEQSEQMLKKIIQSKNERMRKKELIDKYNKFINHDEFINNVARALIKEIVVYSDNTLKLSFKFGLGDPKKIKLY